MPEGIGYTPEELAMMEAQGLPAAVPPPPDLAAAGAPPEPALADNSMGALPPELMELIMMIIGSMGQGADPNAANPIAAQILAAPQNPAGLDGQSVGGDIGMPPEDEVVQ